MTRDIEASEGARPAFRVWPPAIAFALTSIVLIAVGYITFHNYRHSIREDAQRELSGIADLKDRQIANWMGERIGDAQALQRDPLFLAEAGNWLRQGGPPGAARTMLVARLAALQQAYAAYGYTSISLFDSQARLRLSSSPDEKPEEAERTEVLESMRSGRIVFSDIHRDGSAGKVEIEVRAPLASVVRGKAQSIGAVIFRIDPSQFLFPLIQRWPTPSESAESVLVRREGDAVVFLNELRHAANAPLVMRAPLNDTRLLAVKAALGQEGMVKGVDYRGVPVVGVLSKVPGTSWSMVSKIDKAEIYAPIDQLGGWIASLTLVFVCMCGGMIVYWRRKEIKQHEQELQRQTLAARLDYLAQHGNDIILLLDAVGKVVDFNDRALEAYGYSAEEFSRLTLDDLRAHESTLTVSERFDVIERSGGAMMFESVHVRKSGERFPVEISVRRINAGGEIFYQAIQRDITERKKAEDMLRFHSQILNNLSEGVMLARLDDDEIIFTNPQFENMFGYGRNELIGRRVSVLNASSEKTPEMVAREIIDELAKKGSWVGELCNIKKDGSIFWSQVTVSAFAHPQFGKIAVSVHEDITERKNWERGIHERRHGMDELQQLHVAAQTASAIAHELNQPLLAIASYCKAALLLLKSERPDLDEIRTAVEGSERQAHRAGQSIRELFDFLHAGEFAVEDFDLVQEITVLLNDARTEHGLQFQSVLRVEEKLPFVRANRTHVRKALYNLLRNGIEAAMQAPGAGAPLITLALCKSADGNFAEVTVQDNGPGLSQDDAQHLFEPFYTTKGYGFGMGLPISRSLVEMNGGQLWIDPQEGPGAVFHVTLPLEKARP